MRVLTFLMSLELKGSSLGKSKPYLFSSKVTG